MFRRTDVIVSNLVFLFLLLPGLILSWPQNTQLTSVYSGQAPPLWNALQCLSVARSLNANPLPWSTSPHLLLGPHLTLFTSALMQLSHCDFFSSHVPSLSWTHFACPFFFLETLSPETSSDRLPLFFQDLNVKSLPQRDCSLSLLPPPSPPPTAG